MRIMENAWMALLTIVLLPVAANADFIDAGRTTIDTSSGLEWLDLTETNGLSYDDVSAELGSGGHWQGWRYATGTEAQTLLVNLGFSIAFHAGYTHLASPGFTDAFTQFVNLFGDTVGEYRSHYSGALGITAHSNYSNSHVRLGAYTYNYGTRYSLQSDPTRCCNHADSDADIYRGSYLVRATAVPEPGTLALLVMGLAGIGLRRRKKGCF